MADFFAEYDDFDYDPVAAPRAEFYRLCDHNGWDRGDEAKQTAFNTFKDALVQEFNEIYGTDEDSWDSWRALCALLEMPIPESSFEAKKLFSKEFVNLEDLVNSAHTGEKVTRFSSLKELREYTMDTGKFFPRESAYAGGLLRFLLREILSPYKGSDVAGKQSQTRPKHSIKRIR